MGKLKNWLKSIIRNHQLSAWVSVVRMPINVFLIRRIISRPSYYPEMPSKSRAEMWWDNFKWLCKHKELNKFYKSYGLDVKGFRDPDDFLSKRESSLYKLETNIGASCGYTYGYKINHAVLTHDKYVFGQYMVQALGNKKVVENIALINNAEVFLCREQQWVSFSDFAERQDGQLVFKATDGTWGDDVYCVNISHGMVTKNGETCSAAGFEAQLKGKRMVVQNVLKQHDRLKAFGTKCVNTIRIITVMTSSGEAEVFNAFFRLGMDAEGFVDNRSQGGLAIGIDLDSGKLMKYGFPHDSFGIKMETHPISNIRFEGYQLPFWEEAVELVKTAHKQLYGLKSVGWDVVLTEERPLILEANEMWEIGGPQDTCGGLRDRWNQLISQ